MVSKDQPPKKRMKFGGEDNVIATSEKNQRPPVFPFMALKDQCMLNVFQYLSISDLFTLCMSSDLRILISENVLNKRLIDFDDITDISYEKVFAMFGKYMVKVKIGEKHIQNVELNHSKFDEILHQIRKHCANDGALKHVQFEFCNLTAAINESVLRDTLPFFKNVEYFEMYEAKNTNDHFERDMQYVINESVNNFIDSVVMNATKIKSLKFQNFRVKAGWLALDHMKNVETLSFLNCNLEKNPCLIAFMQKKPLLSSFTWKNSSVDRVYDSVNFVLGLVGNNLHHLKVLDFTRNIGYFENDIYVAETHGKPINYQFLASLKNLKDLTISFHCKTSHALKQFSDQLRNLADQNSIENFAFSIEQCAYDYHFDYGSNFGSNWPHFTSLQCVKITNPVSNDFYCTFLSNLPNLKELCLRSNNEIWPISIYAFVRSAKTISVLKFEAPMKNIFSSIVYSNILLVRKIFEQHPDQTLEVYIDTSQLNVVIKQLKNQYQPNVVRLVPFTFD